MKPMHRSKSLLSPRCAPLAPARGLALALALVLVGASAQAQAPADTTPPELVTHVDATYPAALLSSGKHADVLLSVIVDTEGHVRQATVLSGSGQPALDEAALSAVHQWTFRPALRRGVKVASRIRVPFHFAPPSPEPEGAEPVIPGNTVTPIPGGLARTGSRGAEPDAPTPGAASGRPPRAPSSTAEIAAASSSAPLAEEVHVHGRKAPPSRGTSDVITDMGELAYVPHRNATELLRLAAPGVHLANDGGEGHANQVFLRGFDARFGQDVEFSVAGVPVNEPGNLHANGYADLHFVLPELVESVRVVEGPFDPHQGNFAVAGSAEYRLGLPRRGLTAKYVRGSFNTNRLVLLWGPEKESSRTFGGVELYETDGFGRNRAADRGSAIAGYEGRLGERGSYRLVANAYSTHYQSAGLLRADDVESGARDFFDTYDARQGGDSSRYSLSADIEHRAGVITYEEQAFLILRNMRLRENFTGFLLDAQEPLQSLHGQRGDLVDVSVTGTTLGSRGSGRYRGKAFGLPQEVELGYFARWDVTDSTQYRIESKTSAPYKLDADLGAKLGDVGLFVDGNLRPLSWLTLRGGVRADLFTYDVLDRCAQKSIRQPSSTNPPGDASCYSQQDQGRYREPVQRSSTASAAILPKATALFGPFEHITLSLSYGRGARSIDPIYVNQDLKTPFAAITAYEGGASYHDTVGKTDVTVRSVFFQTHVDRDLLFNETAGRATLSNGTTRSGFMGATRLTGSFFDESANVTLVRSAFDDTHLLVPYVPDVVVRSDTSFFHELRTIDGAPLRGILSAGATYIGRRALPYGQRSDAVFTLDAGATLQWKWAEVGLEATNVLDARYRSSEYNFASDFHTSDHPTLVPVRHFSAGPPRAVFLTLAATMGGP